MKIFQSYLIIGDTKDARGETARLCKNLAIEIGSSSPDITIISPKNLPAHSGLSPSGSKTGRQVSISIDQIRQMKKYIFEKPFSSLHKLVIIEEAQTLTTAAQNALLKILEEPPAHAIIILEATNKEALLATIRSRVVTKNIRTQKESQEKSLLLNKNSDFYDLLIAISDIDDPSKWLNSQIKSLHNTLLLSIRRDQLESLAKVSALIRQCAQAKLMIEANVNPKFVLANLIFHSKL